MSVSSCMSGDRGLTSDGFNQEIHSGTAHVACWRTQVQIYMYIYLLLFVILSRKVSVDAVAVSSCLSLNLHLDRFNQEIHSCSAHVDYWCTYMLLLFKTCCLRIIFKCPSWFFFVNCQHFRSLLIQMRKNRETSTRRC